MLAAALKNMTGENDQIPFGKRCAGLILFGALLVCAVVPLHLWLFSRTTREMADDAMISARYARNLARGYGLTYNRGSGEEAVEGYSNFIWTLGLALGER